jgi:heat shock protein HslJ
MKYYALIAVLLISACLKDETISGLTSSSEIWHLTSLNGTEISTEVTLSFPEKGRIAGQAPCNSYSAAQTAPLPWFEAGPIVATRRACRNLALESRYFAALSKATQIERAGDTLLISADGTNLEFHLKS